MKPVVIETIKTYITKGGELVVNITRRRRTHRHMVSHKRHAAFYKLMHHNHGTRLHREYAQGPTCVSCGDWKGRLDYVIAEKFRRPWQPVRCRPSPGHLEPHSTNQHVNMLRG